MAEDARTVFTAAVRSGDPYECVRRHLTIKDRLLHLGGTAARLELDAVKRVVVVGAGKATALMAKAVEDVFRDLEISITGCISVKYGHRAELKHVRTVEAGHPVPDQNGLKAARRILGLLANTNSGDVIVSLVSGGGSALLPYPVDGVSLEEKRITTQLLLACGATIDEINCVRKHLSLVKGGWLARAASPTPVLNLLLSDVLGDRHDVIGSGPFVADETTFTDAHSVLERYELFPRLPGNVVEHIEAGLKGRRDETPKTTDPAFSRVYTRVIGANPQALAAAKHCAEELGYNALVLSSFAKGEAKEIGKLLAAIAREIRERECPIATPACVILGGETTVTIQGSGKGGRNQELALAACIEISGLPNVVAFAAGTDGSDGPTDAAGAWCDGETFGRGRAIGVDAVQHLRDNDSYHYFQRLHSLLITGPTGTNLMDIYMVMVGRPKTT